MLFIDPYTASLYPSLSPMTQLLNIEGASHAGDYLFLRFVLFVQVVTVAEGGQRMGGGRPTVKIGAMESAVATTHIGLDHMRAARGEVLPVAIITAVVGADMVAARAGEGTDMEEGEETDEMVEMEIDTVAAVAEMEGIDRETGVNVSLVDLPEARLI